MSQELVVRKGMVHGVMTGKSQPKKHMVRGCWRRWVGGDGAGEAWRGRVQEPGLGDAPGAKVQLVHGAPRTKPHGAHPRSPSGVPMIARGAAHSGRAGHGCQGPGKSWSSSLVPSVRSRGEDEEGWAMASSPRDLRLSRALPGGVVVVPGCGHFPQPHPGVCVTEDAVSAAGCSHPAQSTGNILAQHARALQGPATLGFCFLPVPVVSTWCWGCPARQTSKAGAGWRAPRPTAPGKMPAQRLRLDFIFILHLPAPFVEMT